MQAEFVRPNESAGGVPFERGASSMHSIRASITESGVDTPRMSDESSGAGESREAHASSTPRKRVLDEMIMRH